MDEVVKSAGVDSAKPGGDAAEQRDGMDQGSPAGDQLSPREHELLKENQTYRRRAQESERKLKTIEDEALKIQQNHEERANRFYQELQAAQAEKTALLRRVSLEPALRAAGCVDVATAISIGKADLLVEEGGTLAGVDDFVADLKQGKPYLFTTQTPSSVNSSLPAGGLQKAPQSKADLHGLSKEEILKRWRAAES